ncbi:MAG: trypsin-like peptidase domain-containing protein [Pirellulales bacterium]
MRLAAMLVSIAMLMTAAAAAPVPAQPAAQAAAGEVVLLDFAASWCGPCRQMAGLIGEISAAGWLVRHVDVDRETELVKRFGVTGVPCYVLLVKGHEVGRINGATTRAELEKMLAKSAAPLGGTTPPAAAVAEQPRGPGIPLPVAAASEPLATESPRPPRADVPDVLPPAAMPQSPLAVAPAQLQSPLAVASAPAAVPSAQNLAAQTGSLPDADRADLERRLMQATARLRVEDTAGVSWGTGTVIDCRQGEALILTCGHIFRDSQGKGRVEVDVFGQHGPRGIAGQVVAWDLKRDLALVSVFTDTAIEPVRVGGPDRRTTPGDPVVTVGCNGGADPTIHHSRVTAVDKYLGPPNVQVAGQPVQGRSGGGLFAIDGTLIGVCNAADPEDNEGLFAALPSIHEQLEEVGLGFVYRNVYPSAGLDDLAAAGAAAAPHVPAMPATMPAVSFDRRDRADALPTASTTGLNSPRPAAATAPQPLAQPLPADLTSPRRESSATDASRDAAPAAVLTAGEAALIDHVRQHGGKAEVICIVRPHGAPEDSSEVFVLKGSHRGFVDHLARAHGGERVDAPPAAADVTARR